VTGNEGHVVDFLSIIYIAKYMGLSLDVKSQVLCMPVPVQRMSGNMASHNYL
jgi:hypothetical protein